MGMWASGVWALGLQVRINLNFAHSHHQQFPKKIWRSLEHQSTWSKVLIFRELWRYKSTSEISCISRDLWKMTDSLENNMSLENNKSPENDKSLENDRVSREWQSLWEMTDSPENYKFSRDVQILQRSLELQRFSRVTKFLSSTPGFTGLTRFSSDHPSNQSQIMP